MSQHKALFLRNGNAYQIVFTLEIYNAFQYPISFPATISTERYKIHQTFNKATSWSPSRIGIIYEYRREAKHVKYKSYKACNMPQHVNV
jgi:hypothetical protein